jgi:phosphatidate cytidylyltransferase
MLKARIITALILAPCAIAAIYLLALEWYAIVFWLVAALGAYEFAGLAGLDGLPKRLGYVGVYTALVAASWWLDPLMPVGLWIGVLIWALATFTVLAYPASARVVRRGWITGVAGILICWAAWISLVVIRAAPDGSTWVLWLLFLVWGADVGAYFAGRRFGHNKLAPSVSPGKTWEGVWGGLAMSSLVCGLLLVVMGRFNLGWLAVMVLLVGVSVFGDLFESVLKRVRGMKDSGSLLPGHGGVLDRIDSVIAVLPCLALILLQAGLSDIP